MPTANELHARLSELFPGAIGPMLPGSGAPEVQIDPMMIHFVAQGLKQEGQFGIGLLTTIDPEPRADGCTLRYRFAAADGTPVIVVRLELPTGNPCVLTIADVWRGADWHEMNVEGECGILFETHPDCTNEKCINHGRGTRCMRLTGTPPEFQPC